MKKLFTIFATFALLCAVGCEEQGDDNVNPNDKPNTEQPGEKPDDGSEIPDDAYISINKDILTFSPDGESVDIKIYSNYKWTLTNNCDWVTTSISSGEASDAGVVVTLSADLTYDDREGTITFSCGKAKKLLVVSQSYKQAIIADENNTFSVPAEGGNVIINYQTSVECEVIIPEEAKSWISLAPATRALVKESATLTIAENTTYSARSAVVKVVAVDNEDLVVEYTINQVQNDAIIADENNTFNLKGWAQSINIAYKTNVECEVIIPEEAQSWISLAPATRALVSESATLNIAENNTGAERSTVVKVVAANNSELLAEYTINQNQRYFMEYTSEGGSTVTPYDSSAFDATIIRNEYIDGKGYIDFDTPITSIGEEAFENRSSLTSITIPDSVTSIGVRAFRDCTSLKSITIPDSVTSIGDSAFRMCSSLVSITIPDGVTSIGRDAFSGCSSLKSFYGKYASEDGRCLIVDGTLNSFAPAGLTEYTIPDGVTSIGECAFSNCTSLISVTIPDSVTSIGNSAFYGCKGELIINSKIVETNYTSDSYPYKTGWLYGANFSKLTIGNGVTKIGGWAFCDCSSLTSITIPDSVTSIGYYAFYDCDSLTSVTIPDSVTSIGKDAFYDCYSLTSVTIGSGVTSIGNWAFEDCSSLISVTIGNGVTSIGNYAFYGCTSLTSITIPDSVTSIGEGTFKGCSSLTSVTIPDSVTSIGEGAFVGCTSLTSITIPDSVTEIGDKAFYNCTSLKSVTIGNGVTSIGELAFYGCSSLISVTIPDSVTSIGKWAFEDCTGELIINSKIVETNYTSNRYPYKTGWLCGAKFSKLTIGNGVTKIGGWAFCDCSSLTSITIGSGVTSIGEWAFFECTSLTSVTIPDSVIEIGYRAFQDCYSLTRVTIGSGVTSIGNWAFEDCYSLTRVYCKAVTPPRGGSDMFSYNASERKIYVPTESVDAYKAAEGWSDYADYIEPYQF